MLAAQATVLASGLGGAAAAEQSAEVSGRVAWTDSDRNESIDDGVIALCAAACIAGGEVSGGVTFTDGAFHLFSVPGEYVVAVSFGGRDDLTGYLSTSTTHGFHLTGRIEHARTFTVVNGSLLDLPVSPQPPPPPPPSPPLGSAMPTGELRGGRFAGVRFDASYDVPGAQLRVDFIGCERRVVATRKGIRARSFRMDPRPSSLGPTWRMRFTFTAPGRRAYRYDLLQFSGPEFRFRCAVPISWLERWGTVRGAARVGRTVSMSRPVLTAAGRAAAPTVRYAWMSNGRTLSHRAALRVPRSAAGSRLSVRVHLEKRGHHPRTHTVDLGRVRQGG